MAYKPVSTHDKLRDEVLADPEARAMYEASKLQIELSLALKNARKKRHLTQEAVAKLMHTHKPVVSRFESDNTDIQHFPSLLTIVKFALAVGYQLKLDLTPIRIPAKLRLRRHVK